MSGTDVLRSIYSSWLMWQFIMISILDHIVQSSLNSVWKWAKLLFLPAGAAVCWCEPATMPLLLLLLPLLLLLCTDKLEPCRRLSPGERGGSLWSGTVRPHRGQVGFWRSHWGFLNPAASCEASAGWAAAGRGWAEQKTDCLTQNRDRMEIP